MAPPLRCPSVASATACAKQLHTAAQWRCFSSTAHQEQRITRARDQLFRWLNTRGQAYIDPAPNTTNYIQTFEAPPKAAEKDGGEPRSEVEPAMPDNVKPFPSNPTFISQPILSEEAREDIWKRIMQRGQSVREVSVALNVEMRRVGAVVRLKEIEKEWLRIGKPLARPYAKAVMSMLPKPHPKPTGSMPPFESINDVSLHAATFPQIFYPTSESRHFTRVDAARVFDEKLLPIDDRIPHPQMVQKIKDAEAGLSAEQIEARQKARDEAAEKRRQAILARRAKKDAATQKNVDTQRWRFRFTDINVDDAGKTGRGEKGVGWRYGAPLMDRKKGTIKIPTMVE